MQQPSSTNEDNMDGDNSIEYEMVPLCENGSRLPKKRYAITQDKIAVNLNCPGAVSIDYELNFSYPLYWFLWLKPKDTPNVCLSVHLMTLIKFLVRFVC